MAKAALQPGPATHHPTTHGLSTGVGSAPVWPQHCAAATLAILPADTPVRATLLCHSTQCPRADPWQSRDRSQLQDGFCAPQPPPFTTWPCLVWRWQTAAVAWLPAPAPVVGATQTHTVLHLQQRLARGRDPGWTLRRVWRGMPRTRPQKVPGSPSVPGRLLGHTDSLLHSAWGGKAYPSCWASPK